MNNNSNVYYDFLKDDILYLCLPSDLLRFSNDEIKCYSKKLASLINGKKITLFLTITQKTIIGKQCSISKYIYNSYGLQCETLYEHKITNLNNVTRICAIDVQNDQIEYLLRILIDYPFYSFAVINNKIPIGDTEHLIYLMEDGMLTPKIAKRCFDTVLTEGYTLLYVLQGFDGYSINLLKGKKDKGTVCVNPNEKLR